MAPDPVTGKETIVTGWLPEGNAESWTPATDDHPPPYWQPAQTTAAPNAIQAFTELTEVIDPADWPFSANVRLNLIWPSGGTGVCSGILIDPRHALTAGHCVYDYNAPERDYDPCPDPDEACWVSAIEVVPAYDNGSAAYGSAQMLLPMSWTSWTQEQDYAHDMGVIFFDRPVGALAGWYGYSAAAEDSFFLSNTFHNSSYPGDSFGDGQSMWTRTGTFDTVNAYRARHYSPSYHGQSGSGYAYEYLPDRYRVYAVTSYYREGEPIYTDCPRITANSDRQGKFWNIVDWIDAHTPDNPDLVPLNVNVTPASVLSGQQLSSLSFAVHNYSYTQWDDLLPIQVYLSTNDQISAADELLYTYEYTGSIRAKGTVEVQTPALPPLPANGSGTYYVGVRLQIEDSDETNNTTSGWDSAQIKIISDTHKVYLPFVRRDHSSDLVFAVGFEDAGGDWLAKNTIQYPISYHSGESPVEAPGKESIVTCREGDPCLDNFVSKALSQRD